MSRAASRILLAAAGALAGFGILSSSASFGGSAATSVPQPSVRRLTESQYRAAIAEAFGPEIEVVGRFEPDMRVGGLAAVGASSVSITPAGFEQYDAIARHVAEQVFAPAARSRLVGCGPGSGDPAGARCAAGFVSRVGLKLFRRPVAPREVQAAVARTLASAQRLGSFDAGLQATLVGMLTSPDFLFRIDLPASHGLAGTIDGYSRASRLSFLLWNAPPDSALLEAAGKGLLDSPDGLGAQVDRMIASPRFVDGVRAFFDDFLQLRDMETLSKDGLIYPNFSTTVAAASREQVLRTITDLLVDHKGDYRDLFTTRRFAMTRALGPIYNVPVSGSGWSMYEFPEGDPRIGLLTQAGLLALHSHPGRTSPTLRGKSLRETVLCEQVPSPPANVNFSVVQDVNNVSLKTTRQRLEAHLDDEECASCHKATDGLGLSLEQFDGAGQFRSTEHDVPIDTSGKFDKAVFAGVPALARLMHDSPKVSQCVVSTAWRYANGRDAGPADRPELDRLNASFAASGHRFIDLMRTIALDPQFYAMPRIPQARPAATARADSKSQDRS